MRNIVVLVGTILLLRCCVEACNGNARDCNKYMKSIKFMCHTLDFMSSYSMKKYFDHFRGYEKYGLWRNWSILRVVVPCEEI